MTSPVVELPPRLDNENNRNRLGFALKGGDGLSGLYQHHIGPHTDQFFRQCLHAIDVGRAPADVDPDIATFGPAKLSKRRLKSRQSSFPRGSP